MDGDRVTEVRRLAEVDPGGEGGLLGLALSPDRDTLFAYFTAAEDNRIVAMSWNGTELGEPQVILDGIPKGGRHNGGRIVVGPDGFLYVGTGEVGDTRLAQDRASLGGKILRITLDGQPAPGNPFGSEVSSYGHRNVEGLAFDPDGRLWASEFGEQSWDELNLITKGSNDGWPEVEDSGSGEGLTNPKVVWSTDEASPAGLAYADGSLWMAALRGERLWQIPISGTDVGEPHPTSRANTGESGRPRRPPAVARCWWGPRTPTAVATSATATTGSSGSAWLSGSASVCSHCGPSPAGRIGRNCALRICSAGVVVHRFTSSQHPVDLGYARRPG